MQIDPGARVEQVGSISHDRQDWQRFYRVSQRGTSLCDGKTGIAGCSCVITRLAHRIDHSIIRSVGPSAGIIRPTAWIPRWRAPRLHGYVIRKKVTMGINLRWFTLRLITDRPDDRCGCNM